MSQTPPSLVIACPPECSFHPDKIGVGAASALRAIRENGAGQHVFGRRSAEILGHPSSMSAIARHLRHYRDSDTDTSPSGPSKAAGDLEILNEIIKKGFENSGSWKPTIKDTMEAMKLKASLTGHSVFQDMIDAMDQALDLEDGDEEEAPENPEALGELEEQAPEDEETPGEIAL
jgi:hypothetical protein